MQTSFYISFGLLNIYLFELLNLIAVLLKDDITLFDYNVHDRVNDFVATAVSQVNYLVVFIKHFFLFSFLFSIIQGIILVADSNDLFSG